MTPPYGGTDGNAATSSYGGTRLLLAMLITWLMGGSASQFMIPLFLNVGRALPPFANGKLPLATGGASTAGSWGAPDPNRVYPGIGSDGRQDSEMPTTWAPSPEYVF